MVEVFSFFDGRTRSQGLTHHSIYLQWHHQLDDKCSPMKIVFGCDAHKVVEYKLDDII